MVMWAHASSNSRGSGGTSARYCCSPSPTRRLVKAVAKKCAMRCEAGPTEQEAAWSSQRSRQTAGWWVVVGGGRGEGGRIREGRRNLYMKGVYEKIGLN